MADKGFLISDLLSPIDLSPLWHRFSVRGGSSPGGEVTATQNIARLRINVERAIKRIKQHHIFDGVLPLSLLGILIFKGHS